MLDVRNLHAGYGRMEILHGLDLHVDAEEIVSLIGANGAGKTTTLRALAGVVTPTQGTVELEGTPLQALRLSLAREIGWKTGQCSYVGK